MPFTRFALIVAVVVAGAGMTLWLGFLVASPVGADGSVSPFAVPAALAIAIALRLFASGKKMQRDGHPGRYRK